MAGPQSCGQGPVCSLPITACMWFCLYLSTRTLWVFYDPSCLSWMRPLQPNTQGLVSSPNGSIAWKSEVRVPSGLGPSTNFRDAPSISTCLVSFQRGPESFVLMNLVLENESLSAHALGVSKAHFPSLFSGYIIFSGVSKAMDCTHTAVAPQQ